MAVLMVVYYLASMQSGQPLAAKPNERDPFGLLGAKCRLQWLCSFPVSFIVSEKSSRLAGLEATRLLVLNTNLLGFITQATVVAGHLDWRPQPASCLQAANRKPERTGGWQSFLTYAS